MFDLPKLNTDTIWAILKEEIDDQTVNKIVWHYLGYRYDEAKKSWDLSEVVDDGFSVTHNTYHLFHGLLAGGYIASHLITLSFEINGCTHMRHMFHFRLPVVRGFEPSPKPGGGCGQLSSDIHRPSLLHLSIQ